MPLIRVELTERLSEDTRTDLCAALSRLCATTIGKPERYVQAIVVDGVTMMHGGQDGPAAFVDVRSIGGLTHKVNEQLAAKTCSLLQETAGIPGDRCYLNFTELDGAHWGHAGSLFG